VVGGSLHDRVREVILTCDSLLIHNSCSSRLKIPDHQTAILPTPPHSKSSSDDGSRRSPTCVASATKSSISTEAPGRAAKLMKDVPKSALYQPVNTIPISISTPATTNSFGHPNAATTPITDSAVPRIQMFAKKPQSFGRNRAKGCGLTNELKSLTQLNASMRSKRHVTTLYVPVLLYTL
jgi:hypothetical protein